MILEKHFAFDAKNGCTAKNLDDVTVYVKEKVEYFQVFENWTSKQEHLNLFDEILKMIDEDIQAPDIDTSGISHLLYYDRGFEERKFILYYDLIFILGSIAYNVFDYKKNALNHTEDGKHGAINMSDMVATGYSELSTVKQTRGKAAYGATLIFTTVTEAELKRKVKWELQKELAQAVEQKIQKGTFVATYDDQILLDCLLDRRQDYDSVYATTTAANELFERADVYDSQRQVKKDQANMMLNKTTLNQLLQSSILQSKAEPAFIELMKLLFGTRNLNLRNDIAHGGFGYQNYYHLSASALLYLVMNAVVNDFWKL